jgi:hypothetical protein
MQVRSVVSNERTSDHTKSIAAHQFDTTLVCRFFLLQSLLTSAAAVGKHVLALHSI